MTQDNQEVNFVAYMCHFLVSLGCISVSSTLILPATERKFFTSWFVIEMNEDWYLVTCGHVLVDIETYITSQLRLRHTFVIFSGMGKFATDRNPVQFDYREPDFMVCRPGGLDFGAIRLTASEKAVLSSNGIFAVQEHVWDQCLPQQFSKFAVLGLPLQNMNLDDPGLAGLQPVLLRVEPVVDIPPQFAHHTDAMRYFKVMEPSRPDLDIKGMSGGPVFAFWEQPGRDLQLIVCAMQSSWLPKSRILATVDLRFAGQNLRAVTSTN